MLAEHRGLPCGCLYHTGQEILNEEFDVSVRVLHALLFGPDSMVFHLAHQHRGHTGMSAFPFPFFLFNKTVVSVKLNFCATTDFTMHPWEDSKEEGMMRVITYRFNIKMTSCE
jgi:hypothetical protein